MKPRPARVRGPAARLLLVASLAFALGACSSALRWEEGDSPPAASSRPATAARPAEHVVQPGETLFGIARRYGVTADDLARWNGLGSGTLIRPGQRLRLAGAPPVPAEPAGPSPAWRWPLAGPLASGYGANPAAATGILIGGAPGDGVRAAADGVVVYAGNSLPGYGELIIVKHDESWLSAYGHNSALLVAEGTRVRAGELIARVGLGPGQRPLLHFEIRRNGAPVDPLPLLPRR